ncbi:MAG: hypothetical protein KGJ78_18220 [Alphaproteobacteria bacterium]|nr:hypothetical protein [Alphaproteobacteria bacterium]
MSDDAIETSAKTLWGETSFWSTWLFGTLVSTFGLISFIQHMFGVHLVPVFAHGLEVYRVVAHTFIGWLYWPFLWLTQYISLSWFHFSLRIAIPGWWKDLTAISTLSMAALMRGMVFMTDRTPLSSAPISKIRYVATILLMMISTLILGILMIGFYAIYSFGRLWRKHPGGTLAGC